MQLLPIQMFLEITFEMYGYSQGMALCSVCTLEMYLDSLHRQMFTLRSPREYIPIYSVKHRL